MYNCSVVGLRFTVWRGSALQCPSRSNQIVLIHRQYKDENATETCGSGIARGIRVTGTNTYTSQLNVTVSSLLNSTVVQCVHDNGSTQRFIGSSVITLTGNCNSMHACIVNCIHAMDINMIYRAMFIIIMGYQLLHKLEIGNKIILLTIEKVST